MLDTRRGGAAGTPISVAKAAVRDLLVNGRTNWPGFTSLVAAQACVDWGSAKTRPKATRIDALDGLIP